MTRPHFFSFEPRHQPLLPQSHYVRRILFIAGLAFSLMVLWLGIGVCGYHWLAGLGWVDSFLNAAMIVGGMGPVDILPNDSAKVFASLYAILSGAVFLALFTLVAAPVFHRLLHRFHLEKSTRD